MGLFALLLLDELSHGLANLSMFPYFDTAHYIVTIMSVREQPGAFQVSRRSPLACWFSSMLFCFGGAVLTGIMMAEPPIAPLSKGTNVLIASTIWYLVFYCPMDLVYNSASLMPLRVVLSGMKEVTRTWKVLAGVNQAHKKYKDALLVMIAVGWAKGAGGGLMSNFEQLVRGVWKPETNELLKMSYPTKITLIGAVLFALQKTDYLPLEKHHLMLIYTVFIVVNKARMMLTGATASPFAPIESFIHKTVFAGSSPYAALPGEADKSCCNNNSGAKESAKNGTAGNHLSHSPAEGRGASLEAKEDSEITSCKKSD